MYVQNKPNCACLFNTNALTQAKLWCVFWQLFVDEFVFFLNNTSAAQWVNTKRCNSSAGALELHLFCTNPSDYHSLWCRKLAASRGPPWLPSIPPPSQFVNPLDVLMHIDVNYNGTFHLVVKTGTIILVPYHPGQVTATHFKIWAQLKIEIQ